MLTNITETYVAETTAHIEQVRKLCDAAARDLAERGRTHDASKFLPAEQDVFEANTHRRDSVPFGSAAYYAHLARVKPALDHHYAMNRHHPEHFADGVSGMNLLDLLEMTCDWMAVTVTDPRNLEPAYASIRLNQERFGYSDELARILRQTVEALGAQMLAENRGDACN